MQCVRPPGQLALQTNVQRKNKKESKNRRAVLLSRPTNLKLYERLPYPVDRNPFRSTVVIVLSHTPYRKDKLNDKTNNAPVNLGQMPYAIRI